MPSLPPLPPQGGTQRQVGEEEGLNFKGRPRVKSGKGLQVGQVGIGRLAGRAPLNARLSCLKVKTRGCGPKPPNKGEAAPLKKNNAEAEGRKVRNPREGGPVAADA